MGALAFFDYTDPHFTPRSSPATSIASCCNSFRKVAA
jgi:hypothetical protein